MPSPNKTSPPPTLAAKAQKRHSQALLDLAEQELGHTIVYAPTDGRLGEVAVKNGQLVSAGMQV